ncbi:ribbon-helix-helix protein, CopG family [Candidatus Methanocrinis natronophilus]|uniref:Ribbon-helix-helix protein, CopG family n=1 Tax=Candidatus Methanocrinis natronophilus TaxID=3033396 RepID=A0ABT5XB22_9EURY|nr:ribbon-helix-helix protein, CopG family [Candidatus Methanocrinis natronophilus]MDF0591892.1 ribbon-helix-helix protein, CopG family [Candidatus Methanocrinis natronophilus]
MERLRQYNVRLPKELIQTLQDVAKETGRDRAELVRDAVKRYFDGELWRDETKEMSLPLSAKVEDLEKRVRRLEIAQSAIQDIQLIAKTDIQDIQPTAKRDIQTARKVTHPPIKATEPKVEPESKPPIQRLSEDLAAQDRIKEIWRAGERNRQNIARQVGYKDRTVQQFIKDCLENGELEK